MPLARSCLTLCNLVDCSTPGFPVPSQLPELAQTHVHRVSDAPINRSCSPTQTAAATYAKFWRPPALVDASLTKYPQTKISNHPIRCCSITTESQTMSTVAHQTLKKVTPSTVVVQKTSDMKMSIQKGSF